MMLARRPTVQIPALLLATILLVVLLSLLPFGRVEYWAVDLGCYRAAALALRSGADPYLQENLRKYADGAPIGAITRYAYPPSFLLFVMPLTWLPLDLAVRVWLILNLCLLTASVLLISKTLAWDLTPRRTLVSMLGAGSFLPVVHCLAFGQASIFVLFWLAATFYLVKRGRDVCAGVCLALCFTKLQVLALVPLIWLIQKRWRVIGSWATALFLSTIPFWRFWPSLLDSLLWTGGANLTEYGYYYQPCLSALARALFAEGLPQALFTGITTLSILGVVIWVGASRGRDRETAEFDRVLALTISASLLTADYVRTHDLVLLLVPFAILLNAARRTDATPFLKRNSLISVGLAYTLPYLLMALSLLAFVLRAAALHITSTLCVLFGLLASILGVPRVHAQVSTE
jgi:hypothetical protein